MTGIVQSEGAGAMRDALMQLIYSALAKYSSACKNDIQTKKQFFMLIIHDKSAQISSHYTHSIKYFYFYLQTAYDHAVHFFIIKT